MFRAHLPLAAALALPAPAQGLVYLHNETKAVWSVLARDARTTLVRPPGSPRWLRLDPASGRGTVLLPGQTWGFQSVPDPAGAPRNLHLLLMDTPAAGAGAGPSGMVAGLGLRVDGTLGTLTSSDTKAFARLCRFQPEPNRVTLVAPARPQPPARRPAALPPIGRRLPAAGDPPPAAVPVPAAPKPPPVPAGSPPGPRRDRPWTWPCLQVRHTRGPACMLVLPHLDRPLVVQVRRLAARAWKETALAPGAGHRLELRPGTLTKVFLPEGWPAAEMELELQGPAGFRAPLVWRGLARAGAGAPPPVVDSAVDAALPRGLRLDGNRVDLSLAPVRRVPEPGPGAPAPAPAAARPEPLPPLPRPARGLPGA